MQAVMLLAGEGTRMRPLTYTKPKPLLKISNETIIQHNLNQLKQNGIERLSSFTPIPAIWPPPSTKMPRKIDQAVRFIMVGMVLGSKKDWACSWNSA
ncbi:MAG: hypothetical protein HYT50_00500 [Candidatus Wildermuthbacteria bacterium]|nr:hypothetical protein [Candidatus Wildermuthbacteria bacterium]